MVNGKWQWIANGHWKTSSGAAGGVTSLPRVTPQKLEVCGEIYKGQIVLMTGLFWSVGDRVTLLPGDRGSHSEWCNVSLMSNDTSFGYIFARKEQFGEKLLAMKRFRLIDVKGEVIALPFAMKRFSLIDVKREVIALPYYGTSETKYGLICTEIAGGDRSPDEERKQEEQAKQDAIFAAEGRHRPLTLLEELEDLEQVKRHLAKAKGK